MDSIENKGLVTRIKDRVAGVGLKTMAGLGALAAVTFATIAIFLSAQAPMTADVQQAFNVSYFDNGVESPSMSLGVVYSGDEKTIELMVDNRGNTAQAATLQMICSSMNSSGGSEPLACSSVMFANQTSSEQFPCVVDGDTTKHTLANQTWQPATKVGVNTTMKIDPYYWGTLDCFAVAG
jgi:hypothetical protein